MPGAKSEMEEVFRGQLDMARNEIPAYHREYTFAPPRRYRFDFCWPDYKLAVELEGGLYTHGKQVDGRVMKSRHLTIKGFEADCEKYNLAALRGWLVLRFPARHVQNWNALAAVLEFFRNVER